MKTMRARVAVIVAMFVVGLGVAGWAFWHQIAMMGAPRKQALASRSETATKADGLFWNTFHNGEYDKIQIALEALTAAYLHTPNDAKTAAHIAWLHNWRIAERARLPSPTATITDDTIVARRYFQEALNLDPSDARVLGFLAGHILAEGSLNKDERLTREGYFMMLRAIKSWPEFNLFTGGYVMSPLPADSPQFREGLEWQWRTLDECIEGKLDRANPDYAQYMTRETTEGKKRVCWNSWIAPHNFEGFFLNMGDMLVKSGDWQTARKIYANARLSKTYAAWVHRSVLEDRIDRAQANVASFNAPDGASKSRMMINSDFACTGCHQQGPV
jgi:tetratricopeptide (TPR) repeat protein